jgi:hypothetical protein
MKNILAALAACLASLAFAFPFVPIGPTTNLAVTGTAANITLPTAGAAPTQVASTVDFGLYSYVLTNNGTQTVFIRCDGTTATASNAMPLFANTQVVISLAKSVTACSAIAGATGSTLYATVGAGQ